MAWFKKTTVRGRLLLGVRVLISLSLLVWILGQVDVQRLLANLSGLPPAVLLGALALSVFNVAISAYKWGLLLSTRDVEVSFPRLVGYYYVGQFFNAFLPTMIGGDSMRAYYLHRSHDTGNDSVSSVVVERLTGLLSVLVVGGLATLVLRERLPNFVVATVVGVSLPGGLVLFALLFTGRGRSIFANTIFRLPWFDLGERLAEVYDSIRAYRDAGHALLPVIALSFLFRAIVIGNHYLVAWGLGIDVPVVYFFVFVPLVELLLILPVSIQGFGVRETAYVYLFGSVGVASSLALTLGVVMQLVLAVFNNVLGGVVYLLLARR